MTQKSDISTSVLDAAFCDGSAVMFPGSFAPFTIGHDDIVQQAKRIFARVVIAIGYNINKPESAAGAARRAEHIADIYCHDDRVAVCTYSGLTAIFAERHNMRAMIRGVRSVTDFEYEKNLSDVNAELSDVPTVFIPCRPQLAHISSSMVRELEANGYDTSRFLPNKH